MKFKPTVVLYGSVMQPLGRKDRKLTIVRMDYGVQQEKLGEYWSRMMSM